MTSFHITEHAQVRVRQRGLKEDDLLFVCEHGTETSSGFLLTQQDVASLEAEARYLLRKAERLRGVFVPTAGRFAKTAYHATRKQQHRLCREQH